MENPALAVLIRERDNAELMVRSLTNQLAEAKLRLKSFEDAVRLVDGSPGEPLFTGPSRGLKDQIIDIIKNAGKGLKSAEIKATLDARGRETDLNSVLSTLSRLKAKERLIEKRNDGLWYIKTIEASEQTEASVGDVAERLNAPDYESGEHNAAQASYGKTAHGSVGSNPTVSAPSFLAPAHANAPQQASIFGIHTQSPSKQDVLTPDFLKKPQG